jgi:hypothetical protein
MTAVDVREDEVRSPALRTAIREVNRSRGHPPWTLDETIDVCLRIDAIHEGRGICSTPIFRNHKRAPGYVRGWVQACHFDWLEPS